MNAFLALIVSGIHAGLSKISGIPLPHITEVAQKLPALVAEASAVLGEAATGFEKLQHVVTEVLPLIPEPYQAEAGSVLTVLTSIEVLVQRVSKVAAAIEATVNTPTAPAPVGTTAQH